MNSSKDKKQKKWKLIIVHPDKLARMMIERLVPLAEIDPTTVSCISEVLPLATEGGVDIIFVTDAAYTSDLKRFQKDYPLIPVISPTDEDLARHIGASFRIWAWVRATMARKGVV
mgnify:CR=1 FL=1